MVDGVSLYLLFLNLIFIFFYWIRYCQFIEEAVIDDVIRPIKYSLNENSSVTATVPHFWQYMCKFISFFITFFKK